jgi:hypothetical protein
MNVSQKVRNSLEGVAFQKRLTETIAWCSLQTLETDPPETDEFRQRQQLGRQGRELYKRGKLLEKKGSVRSWLLSHLQLGPQGDPKELQREGLALMRAGDVTSILPLNNQLRTLELKPRSFFDRQFDRFAIVEELIEKRAELLRQQTRYPDKVSSSLAGGKLLVYEPDDNVSDGASQYQTKGYFDLDDAPPWDTWVCYLERHLISWVPPQLLNLVNEGIAVNCVDCIRWVDGAFLEKMTFVRSGAD